MRKGYTMTEVRLHAPDIECDGCANSIKKALGRLNGITSAEVDVDAKDVAATYDENLTDRAAIVAALEDAGFPVG